MSEHLTKDSYGATVSGNYNRSLLPERIEQLRGSDVVIKPGAVVAGGVLRNKIIIEGTPFTVNGPMMAIEPGSINCSLGAELGVIRGPVSAQTSIVASGAFQGTTKLRLCGDVAANKVKLESSVVYGNVMGNEVRLKDCVVIGVVHGASLVEMENVLCFWFLGSSVRLSGVTGLLFWGSAAQQRIELGGKVYCLPLADFTAESDDASVNAITLSESDLRKHPEVSLQSGVKTPVSMLACYDRIINLAGFGERLQRNVEWLESQAMELAARRFPNPQCGAFEEKLWSLLKKTKEL